MRKASLKDADLMIPSSEIDEEMIPVPKELARIAVGDRLICCRKLKRREDRHIAQTERLSLENQRK